LRALEVYETHRLAFAEAYFVASAESAGVDEIASFHRTIDRVSTINRIEPRPARDVADRRRSWWCCGAVGRSLRDLGGFGS
jgi:hypothetical protein